jgi:hypothetical protein
MSVLNTDNLWARSHIRENYVRPSFLLPVSLSVCCTSLRNSAAPIVGIVKFYIRDFYTNL